MTSSPTPTWYDVLGVSRDASPDGDQGRLARRHRQVRARHRARPVPDVQRRRRRAARPRASRARTTPPWTPRAGERGAAAGAGAAGASRRRRSTRRPTPSGRRRPRRRRGARPPPRAEREAKASQRPLPSRPRAAPWSVAGVARRADRRGRRGRRSSSGLQVRTEAAVADAREQAPAAAERAAKALFSYDYRDLPADRTRAEAYLTDSFAKKYLKNFDAAREAEGRDARTGGADQDRGDVRRPGHRRRRRRGRRGRGCWSSST